MIAIKGMEMPKSCFDCSFCELPGSLCVCKAGHFTYERKKEFTKKRHPNCPLIEIEERKTGKWVYEYDNGVSAVYHCSVCGRKLVVLRDDTVENYPYCHCGAKLDKEE